MSGCVGWSISPLSRFGGGTNENTNGSLRQYFPKQTDLSGFSQADLNKVALRAPPLPQTLAPAAPYTILPDSVCCRKR
jgi:IS30 family transposase